MNLGTRRLRGRPRIRWQNEVRKDGIIVGGEPTIIDCIGLDMYREWNEIEFPKG